VTISQDSCITSRLQPIGPPRHRWPVTTLVRGESSSRSTLVGRKGDCQHLHATLPVALRRDERTRLASETIDPCPPSYTRLNFEALALASLDFLLISRAPIATSP